MKKLSILVYINACLGIIYSLLCLSFHGDVSLLAFPLAGIFTGFLVYYTVFDLIRKDSIKHIVAVRELVQFEPFVYISCFVIQRAGINAMPYALDLISAILWFVILVLCCVIKYGFLSEKKLVKVSSSWEQQRKDHPVPVYHGLKRVVFEIADTVEALVWAVFVIILFNLFVLQLYEIPSESMVPTFLVKDRAFVVKTFAGPKFPLSDVGLPALEKYDRGDVVVFHNPHYKDDRESEVKSCLSQFLYMLTFTLAKTNTDENGEMKADPLVKRITGLPGEQLMMMDGVLYKRTKDDPEFKPVEDDAKWATWNLNSLPQATQAKIQWKPISNTDYTTTLEVEEERRNLDIFSAALECRSLANEFSKYAVGNPVADNQVQNLVPYEARSLYSLFSTVDVLTNSLLIADGGKQWFSHFMTDWIDTLGSDITSLTKYTEAGSVTGSHLVGGDLYSDSLFRLNVMSKLAFGRIVVRNCQILFEEKETAGASKDSYILQQLDKAQKLYFYVYWMDQRNMPIFPANDASLNPQFIPEGNYFLMGDNRYNSLDMRHRYNKENTSLYAADDYSVVYATCIEPQYVPVKKFLGKANFRIWPLSRAGSVNSGLRK